MSQAGFGECACKEAEAREIQPTGTERANDILVRHKSQYVSASFLASLYDCGI